MTKIAPPPLTPSSTSTPFRTHIASAQRLLHETGRLQHKSMISIHRTQRRLQEIDRLLAQASWHRAA
ncbi:MAG: hypothetical protein AAGI71_12930 [Bacteroidota bacterium]